jgi:hypothetical protein
MGPEDLTDEARDMLIESIISGYEDKCFVVKLFLEASREAN